MLSSIAFGNFKCFKDVSFICNKLNIFAGYNGRGKSTVFQGLLLLSQSADSGPGSLIKLHLNGDLIELGNFEEILNDIYDEEVCFRLDAGEPQFRNVSLYYIPYKGDNKIGLLKSCTINGNEYFEKLGVKPGERSTINNSQTPRELSKAIPQGFISLLRDIHYISANRIGLINYVEKQEIPDMHRVKPTGINVINTLASFNGNINQMEAPNTFSTPSNLEGYVSDWLNYIMDDNGAINLQGEKKSPVLSLKFSSENNLKEFSPINIGFGYSYILAIVVTALIAKTDSIVVIENPEAHLHGCAQSRLTELLAKLVSRGVQLFIETHSEHIVNGFRKEMLKDNCTLSPKDTNIYFFDHDFVIEKLNILSNAEITNWPKGFFDQEMNDLAEIARLGAQIK